MNPEPGVRRYGRLLPEAAGEQDVDARLWQDPFAAVADALAIWS
jgi:hypothetical protein